MGSGFRLADPREYRRGVVLGLTLAEILLLLVFLLLISLGALLARRNQEVGLLEQNLSRYESVLAPVMLRMREEGHDIKGSEGLVARLERAAEADRLAKELGETKSALAEAHGATERAEQKVADLRSQVANLQSRQEAIATKAAEDDTMSAMLENAVGTSGSAPERLKSVLERAAKQASADLNLTGQNAQMRQEIARLKGNGGSGLPYCWTTAEGHPIYILKINLSDEGVIVHDIQPRPRPDDPMWLLLVGVSRERTISVTTLLSAAAPLRAQAAAAKCRYGVLAVDDTARTNKPGFKSLMGQLWLAFMVHEVPQ